MWNVFFWYNAISQVYMIYFTWTYDILYEEYYDVLFVENFKEIVKRRRKDLLEFIILFLLKKVILNQIYNAYISVIKTLFLSDSVLLQESCIYKWTQHTKVGPSPSTENYLILYYWSRGMLNFNFLEKGLGIVSPPYFVYDFSRKMFRMF